MAQKNIAIAVRYNDTKGQAVVYPNIQVGDLPAIVDAFTLVINQDDTDIIHHRSGEIKNAMRKVFEYWCDQGCPSGTPGVAFPFAMAAQLCPTDSGALSFGDIGVSVDQLIGSEYFQLGLPGVGIIIGAESIFTDETPETSLDTGIEHDPDPGINATFDVSDVVATSSGLTIDVTTVDGGGGVTAAAIATPGLGYETQELVNVLGGDGTGFQVRVATINQSGAVLTFTIETPGTGYVVGNDGLATASTQGVPGTVELNAAGTFYEVGDILEQINGASVWDPVRVEVTEVGVNGAIVDFDVLSYGRGFLVVGETNLTHDEVAGQGATFDAIEVGSFGNILDAEVNAGGTGYEADDIIYLEALHGGTRARIQVDTVNGGGAITGFTILEGGTKYLGHIPDFSGHTGRYESMFRVAMNALTEYLRTL